jgi:hypothetical protein
VLDGKFEPSPDVKPDIQIRLECLRLATEFGPENDRRDPIPIAEKYYDWVKKNSKRKFCKCETSKKKV